MPTILPSGLQIYNSTYHPLVFYDPDWDGDGKVEVGPDEVTISAQSNNRIVKVDSYAKFVALSFIPIAETLKQIETIKEMYPDALIVGSIIAAEVYREDVVAPVHWHRGDRGGKRASTPIMKPDRFTIFLKEN